MSGNERSGADRTLGAEEAGDDGRRYVARVRRVHLIDTAQQDLFCIEAHEDEIFHVALIVEEGETALQVRAARRGRLLSEEAVRRIVTEAADEREPHEGHRQDNQLSDHASHRRGDESASELRSESSGRREGG